MQRAWRGPCLCWRRRAIGEGGRVGVQIPYLPGGRAGIVEGQAPNQIEEVSRGIGDERAEHARLGQVGLVAGQALRPRPIGWLPFPNVSEGVAGLDVPAAHQHGHAAHGIVRHGMGVARARPVPAESAIAPGRVGGIPFPCVLLGDAIEIGLGLLHAAEQNGARALGVPDHGGGVSGAGRHGERERGPLPGGGIPLPGIAERERHAGPLVGVH